MGVLLLPLLHRFIVRRTCLRHSSINYCLEFPSQVWTGNLLIFSQISNSYTMGNPELIIHETWKKMKFYKITKNTLNYKHKIMVTSRPWTHIMTTLQIKAPAFIEAWHFRQFAEVRGQGPDPALLLVPDHQWWRRCYLILFGILALRYNTSILNMCMYKPLGGGTVGDLPQPDPTNSSSKSAGSYMHLTDNVLKLAASILPYTLCYWATLKAPSDHRCEWGDMEPGADFSSTISPGHGCM